MNVLRPTCPSAPAEPRIITGSALADYETYMCDESRRTGHAAALTFPTSTAEVRGALAAARTKGWPITISAARTGITAGAVPNGGMLLSLERLNRILGLRRGPGDTFLVRCQAGVSLADVQNAVRGGQFADSAYWDEASLAALAELRQGSYFYPPDPTETSAAVGGTVACNASGAHSFLYGPTRPYVNGLQIVLADGRVLEMERGRLRADERGEFGLEQSDGRVLVGRVPSYRWPETKNSAGYFSGPGMDLIDLLIGSEGTLAIITEAELRLIPCPEASCAVMTFWDSAAGALRFTADLRERRRELGVEAIEYVGPNALGMLRARRARLGAAAGVPECLPSAAAAAIYLDVGTRAEAMPDVLSSLAELIARTGGSPERCWSAVARDERERLRVFRHALPETVNSAIAEIRKSHPGVTKLGTDMAVPPSCLEKTVAMYRKRLESNGLDYVMFGHIGDSHVHVNILPRTPEEYDKGWELYHEFADRVVAMGGSPAAEHGIGKLKTDFLERMYGSEGLAQMRAVKTLFDPASRLGVGTLFKAAGAAC